MFYFHQSIKPPHHRTSNTLRTRLYSSIKIELTTNPMALTTKREKISNNNEKEERQNLKVINTSAEILLTCIFCIISCMCVKVKQIKFSTAKLILNKFYANFTIKLEIPRESVKTL